MRYCKNGGALIISINNTGGFPIYKKMHSGVHINDRDSVKAFIVSVSNKLHTADKSKDQHLVSKNIILTLRHVAIALRHEEKVTENILIFSRHKFCCGHSNPDEKVAEFLDEMNEFDAKKFADLAGKG